MIGLAVQACDSSDDEGGWGGSGRGGDPCNQYSSCGTCTPVEGCGWCATGPSQGLCASDPDECDQAQSFSWTWNASGCVVAADASVVTGVDAGAGADTGSPPPGKQVDSGTPSTTDAASTDTGALLDTGMPVRDSGIAEASGEDAATDALPE